MSRYTDPVKHVDTISLELSKLNVIESVANHELDDGLAEGVVYLLRGVTQNVLDAVDKLHRATKPDSTSILKLHEVNREDWLKVQQARWAYLNLRHDTFVANGITPEGPAIHNQEL